jgi:methyltransferase family protein
MNDLAEQVARLDSNLFSFVPAQTSTWDARALLALHAAAGNTLGEFSYLEIGSYLGGSLQALMRDPRCRSVMSIDLRPAAPIPDARGRSWEYRQNTTQHMLDLLRALPDAQMGKLTTFEAGTDTLSASDLPVQPDYCLIDGEHTYEAVLRDARFCAEALGGRGVIAFHDCYVVGAAISAFIRQHWRDISRALTFALAPSPNAGHGILALELGDSRMLRDPVINRAIGSRWHTVTWKVVNSSRRSPLPFLMACAIVPAVDSFLAVAWDGWRRYLGSGSRHGSDS